MQKLNERQYKVTYRNNETLAEWDGEYTAEVIEEALMAAIRHAGKWNWSVVAIAEVNA